MAFLDENGVYKLWNRFLSKLNKVVSSKVDKVNGKGLSTNDYTDDEQERLRQLSNCCNVVYGICNSEGTSISKIVELENSDYTLKPGDIIMVYFKYENTSKGNPYLVVAGKVINILYSGGMINDKSEAVYGGSRYTAYLYRDGYANYLFSSSRFDSNKQNGFVYVSTSSNDITINNAKLTNGGIIAIRFDKAPNSHLLNIDGTSVYMRHRNANIASDIINDGDTVTFMYANNSLNLIAIDRDNDTVVHPDLSQNDPEAADYVKGRTHWVENTTVYEPLNITWDGNTEGLVSPGGNWYKISDLVLTDEQIQSTTITVSTGESFSTSEEFVKISDEIAMVLKGVVVFVNADNAECNDIIFPESGIYAMTNNGVYIASITSTEPITVPPVYHTLPEEFLPFNSKAMRVVVTETSDGDTSIFSADKTYAEISEHILAGGMVYCIHNGDVYTLYFSSALWAVSTYATMPNRHCFVQLRYDTGKIQTIELDEHGGVYFDIIGYANSDYVVRTPSTASVGQTIVVKAVNDTGRPTEWEAVDPWIIASSTDGSTKKFKIAVDDNGTLTATEVTA